MVVRESRRRGQGRIVREVLVVAGLAPVVRHRLLQVVRARAPRAVQHVEHPSRAQAWSWSSWYRGRRAISTCNRCSNGGRDGGVQPPSRFALRRALSGGAQATSTRARGRRGRRGRAAAPAAARSNARSTSTWRHDKPCAARRRNDAPRRSPSRGAFRGARSGPPLAWRHVPSQRPSRVEAVTRRCLVLDASVVLCTFAVTVRLGLKFTSLNVHSDWIV